MAVVPVIKRRRTGFAAVLAVVMRGVGDGGRSRCALMLSNPPPKLQSAWTNPSTPQPGRPSRPRSSLGRRADDRPSGHGTDARSRIPKAGVRWRRPARPRRTSRTTPTLRPSQARPGPTTLVIEPSAPGPRACRRPVGHLDELAQRNPRSSSSSSGSSSSRLPARRSSAVLSQLPPRLTRLEALWPSSPPRIIAPAAAGASNLPGASPA